MDESPGGQFCGRLVHSLTFTLSVRYLNWKVKGSGCFMELMTLFAILFIVIAVAETIKSIKK